MPEIVVLDGRDVPNPEDMAMLAAMYSRSPQSVRTHLEKIKKTGSENFHEKYYVGYGHKSIGDCGSCSIFFEGVSMFVAKAVQDHPLYNGQEASTRYIDFSTQPILNPLGTEEGKAIQEAWISLYSRTLAALIDEIAAANPRQPDQKEVAWKKAVEARAFDIARSLIPGGGTTNVAWHTNLRQAHDHIKEMRNHPMQEVREAAEVALGHLREKYASTFGHKVYDAEEHYIARSMERFAFFDDGDGEDWNSFRFDFTRLDIVGLMKHRDLLASRPPKTELHQRLRQYGVIGFKFGLDFGSYRDIQRQRSAVQEMPLLTTKHGFHKWYLDNMPTSSVSEIGPLRARVERLECSPLIRQYYTPLGFNVPVVITGPLPSAVYIAELRAGETVHPTLRVQAQRMGDVLEGQIPGIAMHHDRSADKWSYKRGTQDIVKKECV